MKLWRPARIGTQPHSRHIVTESFCYTPVMRLTCLTCGSSRTGLSAPLKRWDAWLAEHRELCRR